MWSSCWLSLGDKEVGLAWGHLNRAATCQVPGLSLAPPSSLLGPQGRAISRVLSCRGRADGQGLSPRAHMPTAHRGHSTGRIGANHRRQRPPRAHRPGADWTWGMALVAEREELPLPGRDSSRGPGLRQHCLQCGRHPWVRPAGRGDCGEVLLAWPGRLGVPTSPTTQRLPSFHLGSCHPAGFAHRPPVDGPETGSPDKHPPPTAVLSRE